MKLAVIKTGGKQYIVKEGDILKIEKVSFEKDSDFVLNDILMVADEKGKSIKIGQPLVKGAKVEAKILEQARGKKVRVVKYKPKTRYHKVYGHRQPYTKIKIKKIS